MLLQAPLPMNATRSRLPLILLLLVFLWAGAPTLLARDLTKAWPHWPLEQWPTVLWLDRIIERHAAQKPLAIFDFDGTLVTEKYHAPDGKKRSGQSTWRVWAAGHLTDYPFLFPKFRLGYSPAADRDHLLRMDNLLEGLTNVESSGYMKFSQLAVCEAGMTPVEMNAGLAGFLDEYPPAAHAYLPMLDLMQRMCDRGWRVWIISGSHPLYIHTVLRRLISTCNYQPGKRYSFPGLLGTSWRPFGPKEPKGSRLLGNCSIMDAKGRFSSVYDGRFADPGDGRLFVLEGDGKRFAIERFIAGRDPGPVMFCGGNSDGDMEMMASILKKNPDAGGILVNPRGKRFPSLAGPQTVVLQAASSRDAPEPKATTP